MNRSEIIRHYKKFFNIENIEFTEDDYLIIDWAENLIKTCDILSTMPFLCCNNCGAQEIITDNYCNICGAKQNKY